MSNEKLDAVLKTDQDPDQVQVRLQVRLPMMTSRNSETTKLEKIMKSLCYE